MTDRSLDDVEQTLERLIAAHPVLARAILRRHTAAAKPDQGYPDWATPPVSDKDS